MARTKAFLSTQGQYYTGSYWRANQLNINRRTKVVTVVYECYGLSGNFASGHGIIDSRTWEFRGTGNYEKLMSGLATGISINAGGTGTNNFWNFIENICCNNSGNHYGIDTGASVFSFMTGSSAAPD